MPPACKVFQWIRKAGDATLCRRPRLDDDNNSIISPSTTNVENSHTTKCKRRPSYGLIRHETGERELWRNKVSGDYVPSGSTKPTKDSLEKKKHKSLPVPPRSSSKMAGNSNQKIGAGLSVDTRRFCMVDPFNMGGHRRSYTLDTTWNITAFISNSVENEESPATILIAKKEKLSESRFSIQQQQQQPVPVRYNSTKHSIAKGIKEVEVREARTFRWESRRIYNEKTCSQLYELYENRCFVEKIRDKPLPPTPIDNLQNNKDVTNDNNIRYSTIEDSESIMDPELLSIIDTISLISDHVESSDDDSIIHTPTSTSYESFSDLLITENITLENHSPVSSKRNSIHSIETVETLPVEMELCLSCKRESTDSVQLCKTCEMKRFEEQFESWSSGNDDIDCFILETQLNSTDLFDCLEWIPFDGLRDIELIGTDGYTFQAVWVDGPRRRWDMKNNKYVRYGECLVVLKCFEIPQDSSSDFFDQLSKCLECDNNSGTRIIRCYGITQDLESGKYMLVLQYAKDGNISNYLKQNFADITWEKRLEILYSLAKGLDSIHEKNVVHGNLHTGNVLLDDSLTLVSDLGTSRYSAISNKGAYGVLPFVAPELLRDKPYTMAVDIYSFGTIMWELITGKSPFADRAHDEILATEICKQGLRPEIPMDIPECYVKLLEQCWSSDPFERPCANMLCETIGEWIREISQNASSVISIQFQQSEEKLLENVNTENSQLDVHPEAVYSSRFIKFENLQEPNVRFTNSFDPKEYLALREYIASETNLYNLKTNSLHAENSDLAAEVYEILQYL